MILIECPSKDLKTTLKSISKVSRKKGTLIDIISDGCGIVNMRCSDPADTFSFTDTLECVASEHETSMSVNAKLFRKIIDMIDEKDGVIIAELDKNFVSINNYIIEREDYKSIDYGDGDRFWIDGRAIEKAVCLSAVPLSKTLNKTTWGGVNPIDFIKIDRVKDDTLRFTGSNKKVASNVDVVINTLDQCGTSFGRFYSDTYVDFAIPMKRIPIVQELLKYAQRVDIKVNRFEVTISSEYSKITIKNDDWKFPTRRIADFLETSITIEETYTRSELEEGFGNSDISPTAHSEDLTFVINATTDTLSFKTTYRVDDPILVRPHNSYGHTFIIRKMFD